MDPPCFNHNLDNDPIGGVGGGSSQLQLLFNPFYTKTKREEIALFVVVVVLHKNCFVEDNPNEEGSSGKWVSAWLFSSSSSFVSQTQRASSPFSPSYHSFSG